MIDLRIVTPIGSRPRWGLYGTVEGAGVKVHAVGLGFAPVVLNPETVRPYLDEWARRNGWRVLSLEHGKGYPARLVARVVAGK